MSSNKQISAKWILKMQQQDNLVSPNLAQVHLPKKIDPISTIKEITLTKIQEITFPTITTITQKERGK
jgi:hypothetical protein